MRRKPIWIWGGTTRAFRLTARKSPRSCPLWGEYIGDRWIYLTKGQLCGKRFHAMTSSWINCCWNIISSICSGLQLSRDILHSTPYNTISHLAGQRQTVRAIRYIYGWAQDCSNFIAYTLELLQYCTKPSICCDHVRISRPYYNVAALYHNT